LNFVSIKTLSGKIGKEVTVRGWLHHVRRQGKLTFLVIRDSTGYIQSVIKPTSGEVATTIASKLTRETAVIATGVVKEDKRAPYNGLELQINNISPVIDYASPELEYEIRPDSGPQVLLNKCYEGNKPLISCDFVTQLLEASGNFSSYAILWRLPQALLYRLKLKVDLHFSALSILNRMLI
jgi:hypothetical protein